MSTQTLTTTAALAVAGAASAAAALGWTRPAPAAAATAPSISIVDVRPLRSPDPVLRDLITHTFRIRVAISGWRLLPYRPGATARDDRARAGHWRVYLDGRSLGDEYGAAQVTYAHLVPGTHWIAAQLTNADGSSPEPAVWSEPVLLGVPRTIRCWQSGWHARPRRSTPRFSCVR